MSRSSNLAWLQSLVRHADFRGVLDVLDVFVERAARVLEGRGFPVRFAFGEFGVGNIDVDDALLGVDRDHVVAVNKRDRAAFVSFRPM